MPRPWKKESPGVERRSPTPSRMQHAQKLPQSHTWSSSKMLTLNERMEVCTRRGGEGGIISSSVKVCRRFLIRKPVCNQQVAKRALSEQNKLLQTFVVFGIQIFQSNLVQTLQKASQKHAKTVERSPRVFLVQAFRPQLLPDTNELTKQNLPVWFPLK